MKAVSNSVLIRIVGAMFALGIASSASYASGGASKTCVGGSPAPSTLISVVNLDFGANCDAVVDEVGCGVNHLSSNSTKTCTTEDDEVFEFSLDYNNLLSVTTDSGSKFSTVGFKGNGKKCLAAYASEPAMVTGIAVEKNGSNLQIEKAFACKKEEASLETNLPYINARNGGPQVDARTGGGPVLCNNDETFVGDLDTGRGVCVRCLTSFEFGPPAENSVEDTCAEEEVDGCTDVFQMAVFDTDTKDGGPFVAECGPSNGGGAGTSTTLSSNGDSGTDFQQCNEGITAADNGEQKCRASGEVNSAYEYYGGGSGGCIIRSGRRVCVVR